MVIHTYAGTVCSDGTIDEQNKTAKKTQKITASSYSKTYGDKSFTLSAKTSGNGMFAYKSDNSNVAKIDKTTGKVTLKGYGKATITITAAETSKYNEAIKNVTVTVKRDILSAMNYRAS